MFFRKSKAKSKSKKNKQKSPEQQSPEQLPHQRVSQAKDQQVGSRMEDTVQWMQSVLGHSDDFSIRHFHVFGEYPAVLLYFSSLVDENLLNTDVLRPFMYKPSHLAEKPIAKMHLMELLLNESIYQSEGKLVKEYAKIADSILQGYTAVVIDGEEEVFLLNTLQVDKRAIEQPPTEQVVRGPREGFIESLQTNLALLRYRLPTADLHIHMMTIGRLTKSKVAVCHIEGVANPALVNEVESRLGKIDLDGLLDTGYLEQLIQDNQFSPFPQVQNTERPDKGVANLLEGRVLVLLDGSPFALILPAVFTQFYQSMEDYSERFIMGSAVRLARLVALVFSLVFPSLYVSLTSFNPELIPTKFAVAVAGGRAGVPFPAVIEVLIMEISMEVLREATLRMPQQVGGALSIVGVLVVGEAAVSAGFVSPITVVIVALTTIGSFATPAYNAAISLRMLRFPLIILSGIFGLYGVMVGLILIVNHMLSLRSFGIPYMSPIVPGNFEGMKDTLIRAPFFWMPKRPVMLHPPNKTRLGEKTVEPFKQPVHNTLDPLKVGNERWEDPNGTTSSDHSDSSGRDSD